MNAPEPASHIEISVVIPTHNRADLLVRAVDSVLSQTVSPHEVIVVDDGSTDNTLERLRPFGDRLVVMQQSNAGSSVARNTGIEAASGTHVAFLDSDDFWYPRKIERFLERMEAQPEAALYYSDADIVSPSGALIRHQRAGPPGKDLFKRLLAQVFLVLSTAVVRRSVLIDLGGFNGHYYACEDWDLWLSIAASFPFAYVPETLGAYTLQPGASYSSQGVRQWADAVEAVLQKHISRLGPASKRERAAITARVIYAIGLGYVIAGDTVAARNRFRASVKLNPWSAKTWIYLVLTYSLVRALIPKPVARYLRIHHALNDPATAVKPPLVKS